MPNWVYNRLTVTGDTVADIEEFVAQVTKPIPDVYAAFPECPLQEVDFSFWNVIAPDPSEWEAYASGGWYDWNIKHWGSKWDAHDVETETYQTSFMVTFSTAWSPPEEATVLLAQQYRHLHFHLGYEEENGWGGEATWEDGVLKESSTYDEPSSHEDYDDRGRPEDCVCGWDDDQENWYDDCPKPDADEEEKP